MGKHGTNYDDMHMPDVQPARCSLYRCIYMPSGYVVYRHCFDETKCTIKEGAAAHRQATFVDEVAAIDYCNYRNRLIDERGSDAL